MPYYAIDVVNEAVSDSGDAILKPVRAIGCAIRASAVLAFSVFRKCYPFSHLLNDLLYSFTSCR